MGEKGRPRGPDPVKYRLVVQAFQIPHPEYHIGPWPSLEDARANRWLPIFKLQSLSFNQLCRRLHGLVSRPTISKILKHGLQKKIFETENRGKQRIYRLGKNFWLVEYDIWFALGCPSISRFMREYKRILKMQSWVHENWNRLTWAIIRACRKDPNKRIVIPFKDSYLDLRLIDYIKLIEPITTKIGLRVLDINPPSNDETFLREVMKIKRSPHAIGRAVEALKALPYVLEKLDIENPFHKKRRRFERVLGSLSLPTDHDE